MILWHSSHVWSCWWSMRQLACPLATPILPGAAAIAGQRQGMQHLLGGFGVSWWNWWSTSFASWCRLVQIWAWVMGITWHYKLFLPPFRWCSLDFDKGATHSVPPSFFPSFPTVPSPDAVEVVLDPNSKSPTQDAVECTWPERSRQNTR